MFQQMLKTGAEVQEHNVKAMQGLFEAFWAESNPAKATGDKATAQADPASAADGAHKPRKGRPGAR